MCETLSVDILVKSPSAPETSSGDLNVRDITFKNLLRAFKINRKYKHCYTPFVDELLWYCSYFMLKKTATMFNLLRSNIKQKYWLGN